MEHLKPVLEGSNSALLFPNREGRQLDHLSRHVHRLTERLNIELPKAATETRRAAATVVVEKSDTELTTVATAMSHGCWAGSPLPAALSLLPGWVLGLWERYSFDRDQHRSSSVNNGALS